MFTEPHSTKQIEDCIGWGLEIEPRTLADTPGVSRLAAASPSGRSVSGSAAPSSSSTATTTPSVRTAQSAALAELTGGRLVTIEGGGHGPHARDPVALNRLIRDFVDRVHPAPTPTTWVRAARRPKRALYLCSPIGLGHATA